MLASHFINAEKNFFSRYKDVCEGGMCDIEIEDLFEFLETTRGNEPLKIADVGCYTGMSTAIFANFARVTGGKITAIDNFKGCWNTAILSRTHRQFPIEQILREHLKFLELSQFVDIIKMDSIEASVQFPDNHFDYVFLDGDHAYSAVKKDIKAWMPKVKPSGYLMGHDCEILAPNGIQDLYKEWAEWDFVGMHLGVIKAVTELPNAERIQKHPFNNQFPERIWFVKK